MKLLLAFATSVALLAAAPYAANAATIIRDSGGRTTSTATTSGNQTTFRDAGGRATGTATRSESGQTTYRNNRGSTVGTSSR